MYKITHQLGFHRYKETLYKTGDSWAEPGKVVVMKACECGRLLGYVRDASFVEIKWRKVNPDVSENNRRLLEREKKPDV